MLFWFYRLRITILLMTEHGYDFSDARLLTGSVSKEMWRDHWFDGLSPSEAIKKGWK